MEKIRKQDSIQDIKNILSIDLESWIHFYIDALKITDIEKAKLDLKKLDNNYIPIATENILKLLKKYHQKATFFVLAELYDWYPEIIETIESEGHEIGYHTYDHPLIKNKDILQEQLNKSGKFLDRFKPKGPRYGEQLLDNINIDESLHQYAEKYPDVITKTNYINLCNEAQIIPTYHSILNNFIAQT